MATWKDVVRIGTKLPAVEESTYGAILVDLARIDRQQLAELIEESWYQKAPKKLIAAYNDSQAT